MDYGIFLVIAAVLGLVMLVKRLGLVSAQAARTHLKDGALVVDVRSPGEFSARHLPKAVNIPLDELQTRLPKRVPDKNQVLLLHCLSGTRSGMARRELKGMGYPNAFNLGSFGRAQRILSAR